MKQRNIVIVAGFLALLYWISKRTISKVMVGAPTMRVHKITFDGIEFRIFLPIINESDIPVDVTGFLGQLYYRTGSLGTVTLVAPASLPGFGEKTIEFKMVSGLSSAAYEIMNILTNGNPFDLSKIDYSNVNWSLFTIKGTLKVAGVPLDINQTLLG